MSELSDNCQALLLQVMVSMAMSDSDLDPSEVAGICRDYEALSGASLGIDEATKQLEDFDRETDDTFDRLFDASTSLTNHEKETIISGAYLVLLADGVIAAQEKNALQKIADALKMSEIHYKAALEALEK